MCVWTSIRNIKLITVIMQNLTGNKQLKLRCSIWKGKQLGMGARVLFSWLCGFIQKSPLDTCFYFHALTHRREQDSNQKEKLFRIYPPCINASWAVVRSNVGYVNRNSAGVACVRTHEIRLMYLCMFLTKSHKDQLRSHWIRTIPLLICSDIDKLEPDDLGQPSGAKK